MSEQTEPDYKRCAICGFVIDPRFEATKPTIDFSTAGRAKTKGSVKIPEEPSEGILMSMAMRYDHALGFPGFYDQDLTRTPGVTHAQRLASALTTMRKLYEEVARRGFYQDDKECFYASTAQAAQST